MLIEYYRKANSGIGSNVAERRVRRARANRSIYLSIYREVLVCACLLLLARLFQNGASVCTIMSDYGRAERTFAVRLLDRREQKQSLENWCCCCRPSQRGRRRISFGQKRSERHWRTGVLHRAEPLTNGLVDSKCNLESLGTALASQADSESSKSISATAKVNALFPFFS